MTPKMKTALLYALFGGIVGAATELYQILWALASNSGVPFDNPTRWAISAVAGVLAAGIGAALPYIRIILIDTNPVSTPTDTSTVIGAGTVTPNK